MGVGVKTAIVIIMTGQHMVLKSFPISKQKYVGFFVDEDGSVGDEISLLCVLSRQAQISWEEEAHSTSALCSNGYQR